MRGVFLFRVGEGGERARSREVVRPPCGGVGAVGNQSRPQQQASDDSDTDYAEDPRGCCQWALTATKLSGQDAEATT